MPLEPIESPEVSAESIGTFAPIEVLFEFDCLCTYTCPAKDGGLLLAHLCDIEGEVRRFLVAPTTPQIVEDVRTGKKPLRVALEQARLYFVDLDYNDLPVRAYATSFEAVRPGYLPLPAARLASGLGSEVAIAVRAVGSRIKSGSTAASVIKATASSAYSAVKRLVDYVSTTLDPNANPGWWRPFYDLPAIQFREASFEIQFGWPNRSAWGATPPSEDEILKVINRVRELFAAGFRWCNDPQALPGESVEERRAILEAVEALAPSTTGLAIESVLVAGTLSGRDEPVRLTRKVRKDTQTLLASLKQQQNEHVVVDGVIEALDHGLNRFTLRQVGDARVPTTDKVITPSVIAGELLFDFEEEHADQVELAFGSKARVIVGGRFWKKVNGTRLYVLNGILVPAQDDENVIGGWREGKLAHLPSSITRYEIT